MPNRASPTIAGAVIAAVAETVDIARETGVHTLISYHKCCGEGTVCW